jgi:predicted dehydrogenase
VTDKADPSNHSLGFQRRYSPEYLAAEDAARGQDRPNYRHDEFSGGCIMEQDCHGMDVLYWFASAHPVKAVGRGGIRYKVVDGDWNSDLHRYRLYLCQRRGGLAAEHQVVARKSSFFGRRE